MLEEVHGEVTGELLRVVYEDQVRPAPYLHPQVDLTLSRDD